MIVCLFFLSFLISFPMVGYAKTLDEQIQSPEDSLLSVLKESKDVGLQMKSLHQLSLLHWQTPEEVNYLKELIRIAEASDSTYYFYLAASSLGRYYCNAGRLDSLTYWDSVVDSVAGIRKQVPEALFEFRNYVCRYYLMNGDYELAMNEAVKLQILSDKENNKQGLINSCENLGLIYLVIGRDSAALSAFEKGLSILKELGDRPDYEIQLMSYMPISYLKLGKLDRAEEILKYYGSVLHEMENASYTDTNYPFRRKKCLLYSFYIELYVAQQNKEKALEAVGKASSYMQANIGADVSSVYNQAMARYYYFIKDYKQALHYVDEVLAIQSMTDALKLKVDILRMMGRKDEALELNKRLIVQIEQSNINAFNRQLNQLRVLHDLNEKEKQARELEFQRVQLSHKQKQLVGVLMLLILLLVLLYLLFRYANKTRKLKNDLQYERNSLVESSEHLRIAKEKAEEADHMKSSFLANISHEIRTPLNAIVGFSQLLGDASAEEREEFIKIISNNSELLLSLVNDVLDLSRLEANAFSLVMVESDIQDCCHNALDSVRHRVAEGVKLTFTCPDEALCLNIDPLRLQQLLVNLLTNAAKFTDAGEINLDFRVDKEKKQVVFSVTDTGIGIPPDKQESIFNRFEKVNEFKQGTGLGLSICRVIADRFGGTIQVDSSYTDGARFVFVMPYENLIG